MLLIKCTAPLGPSYGAGDDLRPWMRAWLRIQGVGFRVAAVKIINMSSASTTYIAPSHGRNAMPASHAEYA